MGGLKSKYKVEIYRPKPKSLSFKEALLMVCCPSAQQLHLVRKYGSTMPSTSNKYGHPTRAGTGSQPTPEGAPRHQTSQGQGHARRPPSGRAAEPEDIQLEQMSDKYHNDHYTGDQRNYSPRQPKPQAERQSTLHLRHIEDKVCVASTNKNFLEAITTALCRLSVEHDAQIHIVTRYISSSEHSSELSYFMGAGKVILIATGKERLLLISGIEEAQLNKQFTLARNNGVDIFLILAGHSGSETMLDTDLFVPELVKIFSNQPAVKELANRGRFISTGYTYNVEDLTFNSTQSKALLQWMKGEEQYDVTNRTSPGGSPI